MTKLFNDKVLILDYGSQYTQLIARRSREIGVYSEIFSWDIEGEKITNFKPKAIILSGSPESTTEAGSPTIPKEVFELGVPVLGICYGMQSMAVHFQGVVSSSTEKEFGYANVEVLDPNSKLFAGIDSVEQQKILEVWMSHGDKVTQLPPGFSTIAATSSCPIAAFQNPQHNYYGVQFHPEVTHTKAGAKLLSNFIVDIAGCQAVWTSENIIEDIIKDLKTKLGNDKVILGLSGGVDSSVAALLLHRAIGGNLKCIFIDNGLLRLNEAAQVMEMFAGKFGLNIVKVDGEATFLDNLKGVKDPEAKRKVIGRVFAEIFEQEAVEDLDVKWLAQGTIYPDVIESAASETAKAHVIKSHHNVGGLPKEFKLKVVEPLRMLFKDEVRNLGLALGLPHDMLMRHPFPGPGLGVRVLEEVTKEACDILRKADAIFIEELHKADYYYKVSQAFAVLLPCKSVGVMGDGRKYEKVIALRAVETIDFMTAHWAHLPYDLLGHISNRIINELDGVSRVVYDISGKPPATIEWE